MYREVRKFCGYKFRGFLLVYNFHVYKFRGFGEDCTDNCIDLLSSWKEVFVERRAPRNP